MLLNFGVHIESMFTAAERTCETTDQKGR